MEFRSEDISLEEAQALLAPFGWDLISRNPLPNWVEKQGPCIVFSVGKGPDETLWKVHLGDGSYCHSGCGPADCWTEWEGDDIRDEDGTMYDWEEEDDDQD